MQYARGHFRSSLSPLFHVSIVPVHAQVSVNVPSFVRAMLFYQVAGSISWRCPTRSMLCKLGTQEAGILASLTLFKGKTSMQPRKRSVPPCKIFFGGLDMLRNNCLIIAICGTRGGQNIYIYLYIYIRLFSLQRTVESREKSCSCSLTGQTIIQT